MALPLYLPCFSQSRLSVQTPDDSSGAILTCIMGILSHYYPLLTISIHDSPLLTIVETIVNHCEDMVVTLNHDTSLLKPLGESHSPHSGCLWNDAYARRPGSCRSTGKECRRRCRLGRCWLLMVIKWGYYNY